MIITVISGNAIHEDGDHGVSLSAGFYKVRHIYQMEAGHPDLNSLLHYGFARPSTESEIELFLQGDVQEPADTGKDDDPEGDTGEGNENDPGGSSDDLSNEGEDEGSGEGSSDTEDEDEKDAEGEDDKPRRRRRRRHTEEE